MQHAVLVQICLGARGHAHFWDNAALCAGNGQCERTSDGGGEGGASQGVRVSKEPANTKLRPFCMSLLFVSVTWTQSVFCAAERRSE